MTNRLLSISALLLSICALVVTLLLWREIHSWRVEQSGRPLRARLSDEQFAFVKNYVDYIHTSFTAGTVPRADVLMAEGLLVKARYMHGDISQEEWHRLSMANDAVFVQLLFARLKAGAGTNADILIHYNDLLESSR